MSKKYYIGYLGAHKSIGYPRALQQGVKNAIEEQGHILVNIADLLPQNDFIDTSHNYFRVAYELAARMDLDAYIAPVGTLNAFLSGIPGVTSGDFIRLLDPGKTIVIEDEFEGYRFVTKNNKTGMRALMRHLIEHHGYRKICCISGPETSFGAREREGVYFEEMKRAGLAVEEHMFTRGIFSGACDEVVEELLFFHPDMEAIVCANDHIAFTVYRVLKSHGILPGEDVAVTGFDDLPASAHATPPLSTVRLSAYDVAYAAAYEAVRLCEGKPQKTSVVDSSFVHRISCGESANVDNVFLAILAAERLDVDRLADALLVYMLDSASASIREIFRPRIRRLAGKLTAVVEEGFEPDASHLIDTKDFVDIFRYDSASYLSVDKFNSAINACYDALQNVVSEQLKAWLAGEYAHFIRLSTGQIVSQYSEREWKTTERQLKITQIVSDALLYSEEPSNALSHMFQSLPEMGVKEAYLFEFAEPVEYYNKNIISIDDHLYLRASLKDGEISSHRSDMRYPLYRMIHRFLSTEHGEEERLMTNPNYTIGGLITGAEVIGVMVLGASMLESSEIVRVFYQMAFGLKHLQMIRREKELITILNRNNLRLSRESERDELTGLYNRRGFMHSLERAMAAAPVSGSTPATAAVFYMDLDGLKQINDTYGHDEGDFAITQTARILEEAFGTSGLVGRQGGDEYLGYRMLREKDGNDGSWMIERISTIMERVNEGIDKPYRLEISVGYCSFPLAEGAWEKLP
ncbi:MAG: GGDEF domain-containing protein, partial [Lachnospiraceae bacterium]|nr:GGDEF domain-containing protein [Lachnospiraceae bacterium]